MPFGQRVRHLLTVKYHILRRRLMCLFIPFTMVRRMQPPPAWWSSEDFFPPLFSLSSTLKNLLPQQKLRNVCYLLILLYLVLIILIKSDLISLFFNFFSFDFYIKFVLCFYNISSLALNVFTSNFDSQFFYQILIFSILSLDP